MSRTRLIAQNIPWTCTADDIRTLFANHGAVVDVEVQIRWLLRLAICSCLSKDISLAARFLPCNSPISSDDSSSTTPLHFSPKKEEEESSFPSRMEVKPSKKWFLDWQLDSHLERDEMLLGFDISKRSSDLLQNCDLPPPLKFFSLVEQDDKKAAYPAQQHNSTPVAAAANKVDHQEGQEEGEENASLLRALQLSQTRAREAERKASEESGRKQELMRLLLEDSLRLSAYRRWVRLLEAEISMRQRKGSKVQREEAEEEGGFGDESAAGTAATTTAKWCFTLALCLGIAGVGFALGRCMF